MADSVLLGTMKVALKSVSVLSAVLLVYLCLPLLSPVGEFLFQRLCDVLNFMLITTAVAFGILRSQWKAERKLEAEEEFLAMAALFTDSTTKSSSMLPPSEGHTKPQKMQVKRAEMEVETESARRNPESAILADKKRAKKSCLSDQRNITAALKKTISLDWGGTVEHYSGRHRSNKAQKLTTRHSCDFSVDLEAKGGVVVIEGEKEKSGLQVPPFPSPPPSLCPPSPEAWADSDPCAAEDDNQKFEAFIAHFHREMQRQREAY